MRWCLRVKLAQNWKTFACLLLETSFGPIVERSGKDDFWGAKPIDGNALVGRNVLGRLLMELRQSILEGDVEQSSEVPPLRISEFLLFGDPIDCVRSEDEPQRLKRGNDAANAVPEGQLSPLFDQDSISARVASYPNYTGCSAGWFDEVPTHWTFQRLKRLAQDISDETSEHPKGTRYIALENVESWTGRVTHDGAEASQGQLKKFDAGNVLFGALRPGLGRVVHAKSRGVCVPEFLVLRVRAGISSRFLAYVLRTKPAIEWLNSAKFGPSVRRADWALVGNASVPVPSAKEQVAIGRFLDDISHRIERYVGVNEKLITLLEEQERVFIDRAVKGKIDVRTGRAYSEYRASGLKWLGKVPAHWRVVRNGGIFDQRNETGYPELPILEVSPGGGVRLHDFDSYNRGQMAANRGMYKRAVKGDVTFDMMRMCQGAVGVAPAEGLVSPAYVVARPLADVDARYFDHLFHTRVYLAEVDRYSRGIVNDRKHLYWEDFKQMLSPSPPSREQAAIADAVDRSQDYHTRLRRGLTVTDRLGA